MTIAMRGGQTNDEPTQSTSTLQSNQSTSQQQPAPSGQQSSQQTSKPLYYIIT